MDAQTVCQRRNFDVQLKSMPSKSHSSAIECVPRPPEVGIARQRSGAAILACVTAVVLGTLTGFVKMADQYHSHGMPPARERKTSKSMCALSDFMS